MKNPFGQIVSFEDYVDIIGIPKEQLNSEEVKNRINKWLVQATEQFDSMISGNGQLGRLYRWFEKLEDNEEDNYKKYKLIKAICSWVETFVIKGKFWVDGLPVINSNVDIQINSSSNDSNVEAKRKDIIQDLVSVGLYQTTNFGDNNTYQDNQQSAEQLIEDLIVLSTSELQQNYLRLNPQKSLEGNLDFANNDLVNGGNIIGSTQHARNNIQYYNIIDSTIDLNRNTILGSLPLDPTQVEAFNQSQQEQDTKILTNTNNITTLQNDVKTFYGDLLNTQNKVAGIEYNYVQKNGNLQIVNAFIDFYGNIVAKNNGYVDNVDTGAPTSMVNIQHLNNTINPIDTKLTNTTNLLNQTIDGLRTLKPFEYVGEFQQGTSYKINQLVSKDNNLYLSKEDNNTTTPPSDKWLLLNEDFASINLNDYYTKLEVDQIKTTLENNITSNTNSINTLTQEVNTNKGNITNLTTVKNQHETLIQQNQTNITTNTNNITKLNNEVVKIAGNQNITGQKTFTKGGEAIRINPGATGSAYIMGYNDTTKKWAMGCNGSNDFTFEASAGNLILKAPKGFINASKVRISNLGEPTTLTDATTKSYVDNAIKNASLSGGGAGGGGTTIPSDLENRVDQVEQGVNDNKTNIQDLENKYNQQQTLIDTNKTNIETNKNTINNVNQNLTSTQNLLTQTIDNLRTLRPFKYVGAYSSSTTYKINEMVSYNNAFYLSVEDNNNTTPSTTNNKWIVMENFQQVDLTNYATKLEVNNAKTELQNKITTNITDIAYLKSHTVDTNTDQTINGTKTFAYKILANGGITNLIEPTANNDAATKAYVDTTIKNKVNAGWTFLNLVFETEENERYSNLNRWNEQIFSLTTVIDYSKPITVSFTRYNKQKGNGTIPLGTYTGTILYNPNQTHYVVGTNLFYDTTQKGTGNMEQGALAGLLITPDYIQVQCWDGNDQLGDIKICCWGKTMIHN